MGHKRYGHLPKTERWQAIVRLMAEWSGDDAGLSLIAARTLSQVEKRFSRLVTEDNAVADAFRTILSVSISARGGEQLLAAKGVRFDVDQAPSPLAVAAAIRGLLASSGDSPEYRELARAAAVDAVGFWHLSQTRAEPTLFEMSQDEHAIWRRAGSPSGFCDLSRLFFANVTERYLRYFLEREASAALPDLATRDAFDRGIHAHCERLTRHALETAQITRPYAAGWFTSHASQGMPDDAEIEGFLKHCFGKLQSELAREEGLR